jgi:hypothetical protein
MRDLTFDEIQIVSAGVIDQSAFFVSPIFIGFLGMILVGTGVLVESLYNLAQTILLGLIA